MAAVLGPWTVLTGSFIFSIPKLVFPFLRSVVISCEILSRLATCYVCSFLWAMFHMVTSKTLLGVKWRNVPLKSRHGVFLHRRPEWLVTARGRYTSRLSSKISSIHHGLGASATTKPHFRSLFPRHGGFGFFCCFCFF